MKRGDYTYHDGYVIVVNNGTAVYGPYTTLKEAQEDAERRKQDGRGTSFTIANLYDRTR